MSTVDGNGLTCRPMTADDGAGIAAVQEAVYPPHYHEDVAFVINRSAVFPAGSWVVVDRGNGGSETIVAYGQCYPWLKEAALAKPPALHDGDAVSAIKAALDAPRSDSVLFCHEVTVYRQGQGIGSMLMNRMIALAADMGFETMMLVAVLGNGPLWSKFGFRTHKELPWGYYAEGASISAGDGDEEEGTHTTLLKPAKSYYSKDLSAVVMLRP